MTGITKNRKGYSYVFIGVIIGIVVILALIMIFAKLVPILKGASESKICQYNLFITASTKTPVINNINIPPECQMKRITLNYDELAEGTANARDEIEEHNKKHSQAQLTYRPYEKDDLIKYEMDKAIAKELKSCWDTGWKGNMNFFDEWWKFYELPWEDDVRNQEKAWDAWITKFTGTPLRPPVNCIACARIKFGDDIERIFSSQGELKSINEWMQHTPIPADPELKSYWEYTLPDQSYESIYQAGERFSYKPDKAYLVAFARINAHRGSEAANWVAQIFPGYGRDMAPEDISTLLLVPYEDANEYCTFIIG